MNQKINVGLVEDQILFRQGMKAILSNWKNLEVVFESAEGYTVVDKLKSATDLPHVMLVDLSLPPNNDTEFSGREVLAALQQHFPEMKVIILSGHRDENFIAQLIEMGAHGYLVKDCDPQEVYDAVTAVYSKGSYINERALHALQAKARRKPGASRLVESLSKRELEVLELICKQHTSEEIAERLFISVKTVNGHRINLLEKTGAKNIAGLVIYAIKNNVIQIV
ncbi:MAG TPA: response regulator transcription factor [Cyclobacteriaceae bacterium]|jgi:DNA-binding NarL/FixJ family response regulator|nr:response regulator transcription factor [Cyclobacteriaceae bacterium]